MLATNGPGERSPQTGPAREVPAPPSARGAEKPPHLFSSFQEFTVLPACTLPTISVLRSEISPPSVTIASEIMMRNKKPTVSYRVHFLFDEPGPPGLTSGRSTRSARSARRVILRLASARFHATRRVMYPHRLGADPSRDRRLASEASFCGAFPLHRLHLASQKPVVKQSLTGS